MIAHSDHPGKKKGGGRNKREVLHHHGVQVVVWTLGVVFRGEGKAKGPVITKKLCCTAPGKIESIKCNPPQKRLEGKKT